MSGKPDRQAPTLASLSEAAFCSAISSTGVGIRLGPFDVSARVNSRDILAALYRLYRDYELLSSDRVFTMHVSLTPTARWGIGPRRRVRFAIDGWQAYEDMPIGQSLTVLEWGMNLVIALRMNALVMLHAAALERRGRVMLLPAIPGHGKTTLCAALAHRGWRLFSDEFGLLRPTRNEVIPVPRPMPLKNESIAVIRAFAPEAELGPTVTGTRKGDVAHVKAPTAAIRDAGRHAPASLVVFPRWVAGAPLSLTPMSKPISFMRLASNAFNYEVLGVTGFETLRRVIDDSHCFDLVYSDLDEATAVLSRLSDDHAR